MASGYRILYPKKKVLSLSHSPSMYVLDYARTLTYYASSDPDFRESLGKSRSSLLVAREIATAGSTNLAMTRGGGGFARNDAMGKRIVS